MQDTVIGRNIRRANRNLLWTNGLLIAALLGLFLFNGRYLFNCLFGPFPLEKSKLFTIQDASQPFEYFVTIDYGTPVPGALWTDVMQRVNKRTGQVQSQTTEAEYLALEVSTKLLIVKLPPGQPLTVPLTGSIAGVPHNLGTSIQNEAKKVGMDFTDRFVPVMVDATGFRTGGYWMLGIGVPLYCLGMWNVVKALKRRSRLERHPIARALKTYGDPDEVAQKIEGEIDAGEWLRVGDLTLTSSWLLRPTFYGLKLFHVVEIIWIYKKVTKHSVNFIPTGTTHAAMINTADGNSLEVPATESATEDILNGIMQRVPWVIAGYSDELAGLYSKQRAGMTGAVAERRQQFLEEMERQHGNS